MKTGIKVAEAMTTQPITTSKNTSIQECAKLMKKFDVGSILITEEDHVIGIVTEWDLTRKVIAEGMEVEGSVKEIMENIMMTAEPDMDLSEAIRMLNDNDIRHLPVVEDGKFIGLITLKDILRIEPQLFETVVEKIRVREEARKPIAEVVGEEGICESCGNYAEVLFDMDGTRVCIRCRSELQ